MIEKVVEVGNVCCTGEKTDDKQGYNDVVRYRVIGTPTDATEFASQNHCRWNCHYETANQGVELPAFK